jgi:urea transporter
LKTAGTIKTLLNSTVNSYSQIFFSDSKVFAIILILVSFIHYTSGLAGLVAVLTSNILALLLGFDRRNTESGLYSFNSLLVGLGLGYFYHPTLSFYILIVFVAILTVFLTITIAGIFSKYNLPFLSIPFLLAFWIVILATRNFQALESSQQGIYLFNELYAFGNQQFITLYEDFGKLNINESILVYFKSLGAIFFEYNILAGVLIAIGLLFYSRIAFSLSLIGFYTAYLFYHIIGGNITELTYSYIGFNFILSSIALGGYFIIASKYSYLWVIVLTPLIVIITSGLSTLFSYFQLPVYSLPFNFIVLVFLYILKFRMKIINKLQLVVQQYHSPEKNLYFFSNYADRFGKFAFIPVSLPFLSTWHVPQGQDDEITHKENWKHAWDFDIRDEKNNSFKNPGDKVTDYYCYGKPVLAPADGYVMVIADLIEDNQISDVNMEQNWGNSIVIKHSEYLYSKLSHLKSDSLKVKTGEFVKRGDIIATCGNSGRSPEPHIHFQLQAYPYIGAKTLDYPISHFIIHKDDGYEIKFNDKPQKNQIVSNIEKNELLSKAFHFIPGKMIKFNVSGLTKTEIKEIEWEVLTDIYNKNYLFEKESGSVAYFYNDGDVHYFSSFHGSKKSLLYYFFLAAYRVPLGYYQDLEVSDTFSNDLISSKILLPLHDFIAPFYQFLKTEFKLRYQTIEKDLEVRHITLDSTAVLKNFNAVIKTIKFRIEFERGTISAFTIYLPKKTIKAKCTEKI